MTSNSDGIYLQGKTFWKSAPADQGAFLIGGKSYFKAFRQSVLNAKKRVCILAWDLNSEVELVRDEEDDGLPSKLGDFLVAALDRNPELHIYILVWDFAVIYATEREWNVFPNSLGARHERLHFHKDDQLPVGASHHQKVVSVDDQTGYCGGLDLSAWRWDTEEHLAVDSRRKDPDGKLYKPFHDVQIILTGAAALKLAELFRYRWERATGKSLDRLPEDSASSSKRLWPAGVPVDFESQPVFFSRTYSAFDPEPEIREIERLHLEVIRQAKEYIYFENQYFSSKRITQAMIRRLKESNGPEIIIVMTQDTGGWFEENTMGLLRNRLFESLTDADKYNRLRLYYPLARDHGESKQVYVHAKLFIADDRWVKVGSSNLSNRSMRVDSELDLSIDFSSDKKIASNFLNRLLGVHFSRSVESIQSVRDAHQTLTSALDELVSDDGHTLQPFKFHINSALERRLTDTQLLDPDEPLDPSGYIRRTLPHEVRKSGTVRLSLAILLMGLVGFLVFGFQQGLLGQVNQSEINELIDRFKDLPYAPVYLVLIHIIAGLIGIPINLIVIGSVAVFGPWIALGSGLVGAHLSALAGFGVGRVFGKLILQRVTSRQLEKLNRVLGQRGPLSVALVRLVPVAPFVVVNLVAGASSLKFHVFNLGSALGMTPGMSVIVLMTYQLQIAMSQPGWSSFLKFSFYLSLALGLALFLKKALGIRRKSASRLDSSNEEKD